MLIFTSCVAGWSSASGITYKEELRNNKFTEINQLPHTHTQKKVIVEVIYGKFCFSLFPSVFRLLLSTLFRVIFAPLKSIAKINTQKNKNLSLEQKALLNM